MKTSRFRWFAIGIPLLILGSALLAFSIPTSRYMILTAHQTWRAYQLKQKFEGRSLTRECAAYPPHRMGACFIDRTREGQSQTEQMSSARILRMAIHARLVSASMKLASNTTEQLECMLDLLDGVQKEVETLIRQSGGTLRYPASKTPAREIASLEEMTREIDQRFAHGVLKSWARIWRDLDRRDHSGVAPEILDRLEQLRGVRNKLRTAIPNWASVPVEEK